MTRILCVLVFAASCARSWASDPIPPHRPLELAGLHAYAEKSVAPGHGVAFLPTDSRKAHAFDPGLPANDPAADGPHRQHSGNGNGRMSQHAFSHSLLMRT